MMALPLAAAAGPAREDRVARALDSMRQASGQPVSAARSRLTKLATFVATAPGHAISVRASGARTPEERAFAFLAAYGEAFGVSGRAQARVESVVPDALGMHHVRLRQHEDGVPVTGGEIVVHLRGEEVVAVNGKTLPRLERLDTTPALSPAEAVRSARSHLGERSSGRALEFGTPRLEIFNRGLLEGSPYPTRLAWFVEVTGHSYRRFVWIDARSGRALLDFSQLTHSLTRQVYNANNSSTLPGTLVRSDTNNPPGSGPTGNVDVDKAYQYAGDTYSYFFTEHGRDSYDNAGAPIVSSVDYCEGPCPYGNAYWSGTQMVYGDGFPQADDIVAHELTHAVTEHTANLFYYMQSGALNESFSDIFGESVDLWNNAGEAEPPANRWLVGEDLPGFGTFRSMSNPNAFNQPGKMSDPQFACETDPTLDSGGVHTNSGVPNRAYALMVDGGTYNGVTVAGIGLTKAGKIQYRALTAYLGSASDFLDNYGALRQSCTDLVGTAGIAVADCLEVDKALAAVQMANAWPCPPVQAATPPLCPAGQGPANAFFDTLENTASGAWTSATFSGVNHWDLGAGTPPADVYWSGFATSGLYSFWGYNYDFEGDSVVAMASSVAVPAGARLQFSHSFGFENDASTFYDGGVLEYSVNDGSTWQDAGPLVSAGAGYGGLISPDFTNPLGGRSGFVGESWGYTASQLDLAGLSGQSVRFRFRVGTDDAFDDYGWFIDDVRLYTCVNNLTIDDRAVSEGNSGQTSAVFTLRLSAASTSAVSVDWSTGGGTATAGSDYASSSGTATFTPGQVTQTFSVPVNGDTTPEPNESFFVTLSGVSGAFLADDQAVGTILDDDASRFFTLAPCRVFDTREAAGPTLGAPLTCGVEGNFVIAGKCGVPATAKTVSLNLTGTESTAQGNLRLFPTGAVPPLVSTLNYVAGQNRANNAVAPLGTDGRIAVLCSPSGTTHAVLDVNGYFE
jgi:Zn-dependent metalloprotease